jgi:hypothetical protein
MNTLTKDGLIGSSGLGVDGSVFFHIAANYAAGRGKCFVEWFGRGDSAPDWKRMTLKRAHKEGRHIIACAHCDKPAISLDHLWPYHSEMNYCAAHRGAYQASLKA